MLRFNIRSDGLSDLSSRMSAASKKAGHIVAIQVKKDTSPFVPALTGSLDQRTKVTGTKIIYPGPYARYLYYGKLMVDPETGSAYAWKGTTKTLTDKNLVFNTSMHAQAQSHTGWTTNSLKLMTSGLRSTHPNAPTPAVTGCGSIMGMRRALWGV